MNLNKLFFVLQFFSFGIPLYVYLYILFGMKPGGDAGALVSMLLSLIASFIVVLFINPVLIYVLLKRRKENYLLIKTIIFSTGIFLAFIATAGIVLKV